MTEPRTTERIETILQETGAAFNSYTVTIGVTNQTMQQLASLLVQLTEMQTRAAVRAALERMRHSHGWLCYFMPRWWRLRRLERECRSSSSIRSDVSS